MEAMTGKKPNWWLLALLALIGVLAFQWQSLSMTWGEQSLVDSPWIRKGYETAQQNGTLRWWVGTWINEAAFNYYRPLVSYFHYFQIWLIDNHGFQASTWLMFGLHAIYSILTGVLAFALSQRPRVAYLVTFIIAAIPLDGDPRWLSEFVLADNFTTMIFQMATVICWIHYLRGGHALLILGAWLGFFASVLCKEQGLTTPLLMGVLLIGLPAAPKIQKIAIAHLGIFIAAAYLMFQYGRDVTQAKMPVSTPFSNFWLTQLKAGNWWFLALSFCITGAAALTFRYRNSLHTPARRLMALGGSLAVCALCVMAAPTMNQPRGEYALVWMVDNYQSALMAIPPLLKASFLVWLFVAYRHRALMFTFLAVAAMLPSAALGSTADGIRFLFLLPFVTLTIVYCADSALRRLFELYNSGKVMTPKALIARSAAPHCSSVPESTPM